MMQEREVGFMHCAHCGSQIMPGQRFCSKCGQPVFGAPASSPPAQPVPPQSSTGEIGVPGPSAGFTQPSRLARHLSIVALLWIIYSGLRLIPGLALLGLYHARFPFMLTPIPPPMRVFLGPVLGGIGFLVAGLAIMGVIAGVGLMAHSPWARIFAIVLGCISLIHFPFGTALGIYTLWVLVPGDANAEYRSLARVN